MTLEISPVAALEGILRPPSDKSLTHRAYMFAGFAEEESCVRMPLRGEDCEATLHCMNQLGLRHEWLTRNELRLIPCHEWQQPKGPLDCGNSGTTMRLLSGLVASRPLDCVLTGDASLSRRPMKRVADPLRLMGARIEGDTPPIHIRGGSLQGIDYTSPVASAQIKSCVLLAGMRASGTTTLREPTLSRDHTERMLRAMGVSLTTEAGAISLAGGQIAHGFDFKVPGDISSAAFFMVAAAILPRSELTVRELSVNPTRTGILEVLRESGVPCALHNEREELGEPVAELEMRTPPELKPFSVSGALVPRLIDEIPVLAVLATQCHGTSTIRDATEMRVKESDRIEKMATGLRAMGANVETFPDGMAITGPTPLNHTVVDAAGDHRIAMAFAVAGLIASGGVGIEGAESIATSYPDFMNDLMRLTIV